MERQPLVGGCLFGIVTEENDSCFLLILYVGQTVANSMLALSGVGKGFFSGAPMRPRILDSNLDALPLLDLVISSKEAGSVGSEIKTKPPVVKMVIPWGGNTSDKLTQSMSRVGR